MVNKVNNISTNGWAEWSKHVLLELERLNSEIKELATKEEVDKIGILIQKMSDEGSAPLKGLNREFKDLQNLSKDISGEIKKIEIDLATIKMKFSMIGAIVGGGAAIIVQLISIVIQFLVK